MKDVHSVTWTSSLPPMAMRRRRPQQCLHCRRCLLPGLCHRRCCLSSTARAWSNQYGRTAFSRSCGTRQILTIACDCQWRIPVLDFYHFTPWPGQQIDQTVRRTPRRDLGLAWQFSCISLLLRSACSPNLLKVVFEEFQNSFMDEHDLWCVQRPCAKPAPSVDDIPSRELHIGLPVDESKTARSRWREYSPWRARPKHQVGLRDYLTLCKESCVRSCCGDREGVVAHGLTQRVLQQAVRVACCSWQLPFINTHLYRYPKTYLHHDTISSGQSCRYWRDHTVQSSRRDDVYNSDRN